METKYRVIYKELKQRILFHIKKEGRYQLPSEVNLCKEFDCSRMTVKKALDLLVDEGIIYRQKGKGSFALPEGKKEERNVQEKRVLGLSRTFPSDQVTTEVITFEYIFADELLAGKLDVRVNDPIYNILRFRRINGIPHVLEHTYMSPLVVPGLTQEILQNSIYEYIENSLHLEIAGSFKNVRANMSSKQDQKYLELTETEPILEIEQIAYLDNGTPFEYSFSHFRYDGFVFSAHTQKQRG